MQMKFTLVALAALGLVSNAEARVPNALALQINSVVRGQVADDADESTSSSSSSDEEALVQVN